ncbi:MAG TPA: preQ(1) synthase [Usitatibacteraceae bacterium]
MKKKSVTAHLTKLGDKPASRPTKQLEVFPNPAPHRDFLIHMELPEFTCLCPKTGQPDFATLYLDYIPDKRCVELKSLKLYIWSFRNEGTFHEAVTNEILDDIVKATGPRFARLTAKFWVRGGIFTTVVAEHRAKGWKPAPAVELQKFADEKSVTDRF